MHVCVCDNQVHPCLKLKTVELYYKNLPYDALSQRQVGSEGQNAALYVYMCVMINA